MTRLLVGAGLCLLLAFALTFAVFYHMTVVPGRSHTGPLPALTPEEVRLAARLGTHIRAIADKPHNVRHYEALEEAARYIEHELGALGYEPVAQMFSIDGKQVRNVDVTIYPRDSSDVRGTIVLGAHYDSFENSPGANDNGTGTAAVIELARLLADLRGKTDVRIRLVLFVNEEAPYFKTPEMGSLRYARQLAERDERVLGMFSLETIGSFFDEPGTQRYPAPFGLLYPSEGNFVAFVGLPASRSFLHAAIRSFRNHTAFPSVGGVAPDFIPGIGWSDHWAFEHVGYPAIMLTDTAPFRYPHYHRTSDTPDKIDLEKLARVTRGVERIVREMVLPDWPTPAVAPR